jgi:predicted  nucleic acid-binding Zn-ribbon protein
MINMKVKVYVKSSAKVQEKYYEQIIAEAYAENEELFQKNRDLERQIVCMERDLKKANETIALRERQFVDMGRKIDALSAEASLYQHAEREVDEWKEVADDLADTVRDLRDQLASAHKRIEEQQRTIVDCSDTITTLKTTAELRPQFSNLWQLLKETGMIVDTEGGVHNHE